jgi:hypothetical protein
MYKLQVTWSGAADKLYPNGEFFRTGFMTKEPSTDGKSTKILECLHAAPNWIPTLPAPGPRTPAFVKSEDGATMVSTYYFNTQADAEMSVFFADTWPAGCFVDKAAYDQYKADHITRTVVVSEVV